MKAYKVFDFEWKCQNFQYKVGKEYHLKGELIICENGFHACEKLSDCFNYKSFDIKNKVAEVDILGNIVYDKNDNDKLATDWIKIVKEVTWQEVLVLCNSGHSNSGDSNSGDRNSGHSNSGDSNSGDRNSGRSNSGNWNSGDRNSGHSNSGDRNSGDRNSGHSNSGDSNSGDRNSGRSNSGDRNSGDRNSGRSNSGNWNSGDRNSGDCNSTNPDNFRLFNKWITKEEFENIQFPNFFYFNLTKWVSIDTCTEQERIDHKQEIETSGGFLITIGYEEAWKLSWLKTTKEDRESVKLLPGFDKSIFYDISGIDIDKDLK